MWIIRLALNRPYTFVVAALLLLLVTPFVLIKTPTDIFPSINIPVVSIIWSYNGLSAREIEQRIIYTQERARTTTVNNIEPDPESSEVTTRVVRRGVSLAAADLFSWGA
jgi:multidrug efflux pump subunit AcrB